MTRLPKVQTLASPRLVPSPPISSVAVDLIAPQRLLWWAAPVKSLPQEMCGVLLSLGWLVAAAAWDAFVFILFLYYFVFLFMIVDL